MDNSYTSTPLNTIYMYMKGDLLDWNTTVTMIFIQGLTPTGAEHHSLV